jgi:hypothetical protein
MRSALGALTRVMSRLKALYRGWAIPCAGRDVYYTRHRAEWLGKIKHAGVHGPLKKVKLRGLAKADWLFVFSCAAFNLIRIPKLRAQSA